MKKFTLILFFMIFTLGTYAKDTKWHTLKGVVEHVGAYQSADYHLREDVVALEIRTYGFNNNYKKYKQIPIGVYKTPLNELNVKLLKKFRNAMPNLSNKNDIRNPPDFRGNRSRAFVIRGNDDLFHMNEIIDVISFLGEIDTPAEAQLVWWMHAKYSGRKDTEKWKSAYSPLLQSGKYRKTSKGYEMMMTYSISGGYGERYQYCNVTQDFTDKVIVDKKGTIVYFKQMHKSKVRTECSLVTPYHQPEDQKKDPLEVLND